MYLVTMERRREIPAKVIFKAACVTEMIRRQIFYESGKEEKMGKWIALILVVVLIVYIISMYNKLVRQKVVVDEAFSTMDIYMKKRFDLIPNLVETVKGYAKHESETLSKIVAQRQGGYGQMSPEEKVSMSVELSKALPKVLAVAEAYPELKADTNFLNLSDQLSKVEGDIANARKYYNGAVRNYNISIAAFPSNIIASMFQFTVRPMFEVGSEEERENVQVKF